MLSAVGIYNALKTAFEFEAEIGFRAFIRGTYTTKWVIAADFVTSGTERVNDTFAFTVYPYEHDSFSQFLMDNRAAIPADIKRVKHLNPTAAAFLADRRRFHFCFIPDRSRHELVSLEVTQTTVNDLIKQILGWPESASKAYYVRKLEALKQRAKKSTFNYPLLHDITLLSMLSAYIALLITKHSRPEMIMWALDRDAMTSAFEGILYDFSYLNFYSLCGVEGVNRKNILLSNTHDQEAKDGQSAWFDDLIRAPDYIAGAMARWNFADNQGSPIRPKFTEVIESVISENPNLILFAIRYSILGISCSRMRVFNNVNTNRAAYDYRSTDIVDYLAWTVVRRWYNEHITYKRGISDTSAINRVGLRIWWRAIG